MLPAALIGPYPGPATQTWPALATESVLRLAEAAAGDPGKSLHKSESPYSGYASPGRARLRLPVSRWQRRRGDLRPSLHWKGLTRNHCITIHNEPGEGRGLSEFDSRLPSHVPGPATRIPALQESGFGWPGRPSLRVSSQGPPGLPP